MAAAVERSSVEGEIRRVKTEVLNQTFGEKEEEGLPANGRAASILARF
jgi:hypothetical protein